MNKKHVGGVYFGFAKRLILSSKLLVEQSGAGGGG